MVLINRNVSNVDPSAGGFEPIPAGHYPAQITNSEVKATKAGTGSYLTLEFTLIGEKYAGRKIWLNLNLDNPNPKAVEIAEQQLATICDAIGHNGNVQDSQELHMKPMLIGVTIRKDDQYGDKNEIKSFSNINGDVSSKNAAPAASTQPPVAAQQGFVPPGLR